LKDLANTKEFPMEGIIEPEITEETFTLSKQIKHNVAGICMIV
jgi:hypothetical protein